MKLVRGIAALLVLAVLAGSASAEVPMQTEVPAATSEPKYAPAGITGEEIGAFVEMMFGAAAGTDTETEAELRAEMPEEEIRARNAENAQYRARTLPWLMEAFRPEETEAEAAARALQEEMQAAEPTAEPTPEPTPERIGSEDGLPAETEAEAAEEEIIWTAEDSYAAFSERERGREYLAQMAEMGAADMETALQLTREICGMWMAQVNHAALERMNSDYACWIYAPETPIDYPVAHGADNNRYLKRMLNGGRNSSGTLFIDYRNLPDFQDPNTLVYGHHMRNDSMFGSLTEYVAQAYFEGHPFLLVTGENGIYILEAHAGYTTTERDHCYDIAISDEEDMKAFLREAEQKSDFESGLEIDPAERLATLSTCTYSFRNARYVVITRLTPVWENPFVVSLQEETQDMEIIIPE